MPGYFPFWGFSDLHLLYTRGLDQILTGIHNSPQQGAGWRLGIQSALGSQKEVEDSTEQNEIGSGNLHKPWAQHLGLGWAKPHLEVVGVGDCPHGEDVKLADLELKARQPHPPRVLPLLLVHQGWEEHCHTLYLPIRPALTCQPAQDTFPDAH